MKIRLIVPHKGNNGLCIDPISKYGQRIADIAGGFTAWQATGGWIGGNGLCVELVTVFDCSLADGRLGLSPGQTCPDVLAFRRLAQDIAIDLAQDCVYLEIDGKVEYVKQ